MIQHMVQGRSVLIKAASVLIKAVLHYDRKLDKSWSHGRGICRNFKNCHCIYVYAPPTCEFKGYIV